MKPYQHMSWTPLPWVNAWSPDLAQLEMNLVELGVRVCMAYDDEACWGFPDDRGEMYGV